MNQTEFRRQVFGAVLAHHREAAKLTQQALASKLDMTQSSLSRIERGETSVEWLDLLGIVDHLPPSTRYVGPDGFYKHVLEVADKVVAAWQTAHPGRDVAAPWEYLDRTGLIGLLSMVIRDV